jgi:hypothetical protein
VARLARQFVCVRIQAMNGVNLNLFPFDYDLTWMAFFMDGSNRVYARYGGREDRAAESHLTKASLVKVMRQALELHGQKNHRADRSEPPARPVRTPEDIPTMGPMMAARKSGNRCIHCHDVKAAELGHLRRLGKFSRELIYRYPMPSAVGLEMDPDEQDRVRAVRPRSPAARAGLRPDDVVRTAAGQRILTAADFARVLELTPREAKLPVEVRRSGETVRATLRLSGDWRRSPDPSWRASTYWAGPNAGFWGEPLGEAERRKAGIPEGRLALRVTFLFPGHPTPQRAELRLKDVVIAIDGKREARTARQLNGYLQMNRNFGDRVPVVVLRGGREVELTLQLPDRPPPLQ